MYEAIDYTPRRVRGKAVVKEYMAHHQGMILLSIANQLSGGLIPERFHRDPRIRSVELLLQERLPQVDPVAPPRQDMPLPRPRALRPEAVPWRADPAGPRPQVHVLSNGRLGTMITASGAGYLTWEEADLTRWRSDGTLEPHGVWIYLQEEAGERFWSIGEQPTGGGTGEAILNAHMVSLMRRNHDLAAQMDVVVPPEEDIEIRRVTLYNPGDTARTIRITSYGEVILAPQATDARHPAFNKLFVESEWVDDDQVLLFRRRPRSEDEKPLLAAHFLTMESGSEDTKLSWESDRAAFIGRDRTVASPQALEPGATLTRTTGATLDPIYSIQAEIELGPHETRRVAYLTAAGSSRDELLALARRYRTWTAVQRAFVAARTAAETMLHGLALQPAQLRHVQSLLSLILYPNSALRAPADVLSQNQKGQPGLWPHGISGDFPILLVKIRNIEDQELAREALQAYAYWQKQRVLVDLVFWNELGMSYSQVVPEMLRRAISASGLEECLGQRGGIFVIHQDQAAEEDRILLEACARAILRSGVGSIASQLAAIRPPEVPLPAFLPERGDLLPRSPLPDPALPGDLQQFNGYGGFSPDGKEYVITRQIGKPLPAPWVNVIANEESGFIVSASGSSYTWSQNSGENRLTPWSNDPVSDPSGEAVYLRDEETGVVWSPTPLPAGGEGAYLVRYGAGYTRFEHASQGLQSALQMHLAANTPAKMIHLSLTNPGDSVRRVTVTFYAEWVLGFSREASQAYVIPEFDGDTQALLARNPYAPEFGSRVAFAAASRPLHGLTCDRQEFLGRLGSREFPAALGRIGLSGRVEAGLEPCAALQVHLNVFPGETEDVCFFLGQAEDRQKAIDIVNKLREPGEVRRGWQQAQQVWDDILGVIQVHTPDPKMDLLLNRWLLYQALACRVWARSAFYQSSGAFGFRDQLQDVMALVHTRPDLAREHILRAARHQFDAGDVLHWWHPPSGRGVRTRFSDDLLWLPYVTAYYIESTGDEAILSEKVPFLVGPILQPAEEDHYGSFTQAYEEGTLYDHCLRAISRGHTRGPHGLPLIGTGDWNDGLNRVGVEGRGESVWLAWFLLDIWQAWEKICLKRGETAQAQEFRKYIGELKGAIEENAWDGVWYRRAYYDDGWPIGSAKNRECQIDSLAQSWAVLSGSGEPDRALKAVMSAYNKLVKEKPGIVLLFTPPFDKTPRDPGYIKAYVPGVRENGGQYTHAALWLAWSFTKLGDGDIAATLFSMLNPLTHSATEEEAAKYKVEPYVVAADVYSNPQHLGRGGWTWYTGSASWMYRLGVEAILGLRREGDTLVLQPCIPRDWKEYTLNYRWDGTIYHIRVTNPNRGSGRRLVLSVGGQEQADGRIKLEADQGQIAVDVTILTDEPEEIG